MKAMKSTIIYVDTFILLIILLPPEQCNGVYLPTKNLTTFTLIGISLIFHWQKNVMQTLESSYGSAVFLYLNNNK